MKKNKNKPRESKDLLEILEASLPRTILSLAMVPHGTYCPALVLSGAAQAGDLVTRHDLLGGRLKYHVALSSARGWPPFLIHMVPRSGYIGHLSLVKSSS